MEKTRGCIFVVDDQKEIVESIEAQFCYRGFEVIKALNGKRALELADQIRPDLIITDIRMPKLDGIAFIRKFKARLPQVKVIVITGYYSEYEKDIKKLREDGLVDGDIKKPFYSSDLEELAFDVLQLRKEKEEAVPKGKLLIVDDEPDVTDFLVNFFREKGYVAASASRVDEAIALFEKFAPDIVLTDIRMPGRDGIELIKEIRQRSTRVKIIVMTVIGDRPTEERLRKETGIIEYISKPFNFREIEAVVEKVRAMLGE